jgi:hypothetical protein
MQVKGLGDSHRSRSSASTRQIASRPVKIPTNHHAGRFVHGERVFLQDDVG